MSSHQVPDNQFILTVSCKAKSGIISGVTSYLADRGCYISELSQYDDPDTHQFFMRAVGYIQSGNCTLEDLRSQFNDIAEQHELTWQLFDANSPTKVLIMVSKFDHCLDDLLYRLRKGELNMEVTAIVSNHLDLRPMA